MNELKSIEQTAGKRSVSEITTSLVELLQGHQAVAYVVCIKQDRTVKGWAENKTLPADPVMLRRLEAADNLARIVCDSDRPWVSRAWLIGCNPHLGEDAPMDHLQALKGTYEDVPTIVRLHAAADQFATS